jgi:hypothetical protein
VKKLVQALSAAVVSTAFMGSMAGAVGVPNQLADCDSIVIVNTGPDSNNQGVCTINTNVVVTCTNNIYVLSQNEQDAVTGKAQVIGNTTGGSAITGAATNENNQVVNIGASCAHAPEVPCTSACAVAVPVEEAAGGGSGASSAPAAVAPTEETPGGQGEVPAELPNTASAPVAAIAVGGITITALLAGASRLAVVAYRHHLMK